MDSTLSPSPSQNVFPCEQSSKTQLNGGDIIDDAAMRAQMHAVLDTTRPVWNVSGPASLAKLGFVRNLTRSWSIHTTPFGTQPFLNHHAGVVRTR